MLCPLCDGSGGKENDCPECDGEGSIPKDDPVRPLHKPTHRGVEKP